MATKKPSRSASAAEQAARREVIEMAFQVTKRGLSPGRSGNVSCRWKAGMLITPSGVPFDALKPRDIVYVDEKGLPAKGALKPSSEWLFHQAVYRQRPDIGGVVHTHSTNAVVLACAHRPIPAFHYMVAAAGGKDIPCVPYATFGSDELATFVGDGLKHRDACLLANHGQVAAGPTVAAALELAAEVETLAEQYVKVLALGTPHLLSDAEMANVLQRFKSYGQRAQGG